MEQRARDVLAMGKKLFDKKQQLDSLWQEIALNFYPERADFTNIRLEGEEYADHLYNSYPVLARRELGNIIAASLRPRSQKWFSLHVENDDINKGDAERKFLEYIRDVQWRAMYDRAAGLVRATKQADHDFAAFGNAVIKFGPNIAGDGLLYRNYHLRDCAWSENAEGKVDVLYRKWKPTARQLVEHFPDKASPRTKDTAKKSPHTVVPCQHVVLPTSLYNEFKTKTGTQHPYVSLYIEEDAEVVLEETGLNYFCYVIPRWHTISGSAYAVSMATSIVLPDGRTIQVMTRTIREAGEKYVDPPMVAVGDAIRNDVALYAGGVTNVDAEYDERLGDVLRPITQVKDGMPIGFELSVALKEDIRSGFFLDKIQLPETGKDMTAFEVRRRIEEHLRAQAPLFEPIEQEYNDPLCEGTFEVLRDFGAFPVDEMPETLVDSDIRFEFRSPLADMAERQEAETFLDVRDRILLPTAEVDPSVMAHANMGEATRDAMQASGWKADWFNPPEVVEQRQKEMQQEAMQAKGMETLDAAGRAAESGGKGIEAMNNAGA